MDQIKYIKNEKRKLNNQLKENKKKLKKLSKEDDDEGYNCSCSCSCLCCFCFRKNYAESASPFVMEDIGNYNNQRRELEGEQSELQEKIKILTKEINILKKEQKNKRNWSCCK